MSRSPNPFGGPNPFADPAVTVYTEPRGGYADEASYDVTPATGAWGGPSTYGSLSQQGKTNGRSKQTDTERELSKREEEIRQREKQLEERNQELEKQRPSVEPTAIKNWPSCVPLLYHDIEAEVPDVLQTSVRRAYHSYLLFCATVLFNLLALVLGLAEGGDFLAVVFAFIYAALGIPGAFIVWYRRLYNAAALDRSVTFLCFFLGCAIHIGFCLWASIPIPGIGFLKTDDSSFAGLLEVLDKFDKAMWLGVIYLIGFVLWVGNIVLSIYVWQRVMRDFRTQGRPQQVQKQAQVAVGRAAITAATNSV